MVDVTKLRETIEMIQHLGRRRQGTLSVDFVLADLALPTESLLNAMESNRGERWLTLTEAIRQTGKRRNFFEKPLQSLGKKCRLEVWQEEGFADRTEERIWLISPIQVREAAGRDDVQERATEREPVLDIEALAAEFTKSA